VRIDQLTDAGALASLNSAPQGLSTVEASADCANLAPTAWKRRGVSAYTGEAEHRDRSNVNAPIGDRDRSEATLAGRSAVELALLSPRRTF
jgi:hypothetical protein